jgi:hypothetical protein
MWSQIQLLSPNFDFGAQIFHKIFKILYPNFNHVIYNSRRFQNAILHQNRPTNGWDIIKRRLKNMKELNKIIIFNVFLNSIWTGNWRLSTLFWWYLSHLLADFVAKYSFRNVISCRKYDWNLDLKFVKFRVKVGLQSQNLLKKVKSVFTFSWITLKFKVFCWDKYYFSESLGCKLMKNYGVFQNISIFFQRIIKHSKIVWQPTCLETSFILILNFQQISTKHAPKNQKRTIFHKFKQFWWIFNILCVLCLGLLLYF